VLGFVEFLCFFMLNKWCVCVCVWMPPLLSGRTFPRFTHPFSPTHPTTPNPHNPHKTTGAYYLEASAPQAGNKAPALLTAALADDSRFAFTQAFSVLGAFNS
jgi:hypothetical protein